jgi:hypothetical protein
MTPILVSLVALAISIFSLLVASERFRLDLYNKRFDIYMRTVKFYQALMRSKEAKDDGIFAKLQADFIIASRESKFLFSPGSGVYNLLSRLNMASFKITGSRDLPKEGLPPEVVISLNKEFQDALKLWNSSIEPLEDLMAPYLNYHYASVVGLVQLWWRKVLPRTSWGDRRGGSG